MKDRISDGALLLGKKDRTYFFVVTCAVLVVLIALMIFYFFFGCAYVEGQSMENTLHDSQRCLLLRHGYDIERGDIITLKHPNKKDDKLLIKRAVALGGDRILYVRTATNQYVDFYLCKAGESTFKLQNEKYLKESKMTYGGSSSKFSFDINGDVVPTASFLPREEVESIDLKSNNHSDKENRLLESVITVKADHVYYLGDNRNHSSDSRYYGMCRRDDIIGKVISIAEPDSFFESFLEMMFYIKD